MTMDTTVAMSTEELDAQLVSTLREIDPHNYVYLFERCKICNVDARHLRFFKKDQIRELIPKSELGIIVEFEYLLNLWQISKGYTSLNAKIQLNRDNESNNLISPKLKPQAQSNLITVKEEPHIVSNNEPVVVAKQAIDIKPSPINLQGHQISSQADVVDDPEELLTVLNSNENSKTPKTAKRLKYYEDDEEKFTLETIIPELLKELKDSYESKDSLSENERRLLCRSIVDYFVNRNIKFRTDTMAELAEQIVEHFPTEDKKSWCNRDPPRTCGRFCFRLHNSRKKIAKQSINTSTSRVVTYPTTSEDENSKTSNAKRMKFEEDDEEKFTLERIIPELLKELKDSYESKNSLSTNERRFLCSSIVDYFVSRKIEFSSYTMDELAEQIVEHFPTEDKKSWCNRNGTKTSGRLIFRLRNSRRNMAKQISTNSISSEDEEEFTLETIIPELLKELKDSYESKEFLSRNERRLLCRSIVDYFQSREIKFSLITMDELTEQIVQHFPTEDKKSWCNRNGPDTRGRLLFRLRYLRKKKAKQTSTNSTSSEDECDEEELTLETIITELLKELKDSYESKEFLSRNERSLLCSSIVDYFESRKIIFSSYTMDDLAEQIVEHFPTEDKKSWCNRNGARTSGRFFYRLRNSRRNMAKQTFTNSIPSEDEDDEQKFTLETIIPELLKELKDSYESKDSLSENERRLLCSSIVDYFESRKIKFSSDTMDELAEQIVQHFPTEDKKSWCNRDPPRTCGRFSFRLRNSRRNMAKQTFTNSIPSEDEDDEEKFTLETIIPELLKELKDSYELKNSLSTNERRFLCSSIVDYFVSRKFEFSSYTMDELAEQIVEHFPTEDKKSWYDRDGPYKRGRLFIRLRNTRRGKRFYNTSTSKVVTNSTSSDDEYDEEQFTLEIIIPELLEELKDSYESKDSLSENERRLLSRSIVDYFESRKIKFSLGTMDELAEQIVEHFPTEDKKSWCNRVGPETRGRLLFRLRNSRRNKQPKKTSTSKVKLEKIIPELLKILKDSYESKNSLSTNERRFLCRSIVDYFESRKIKFSSDTMDELAEQIVQHFPTEDKKSWYDRDGCFTGGSLYSRVYNTRRNMAKETKNTSTINVATNSISTEDDNSKISNAMQMKFDDDEEKFTLETIIPELLKELKDSYESKDSLSENERRLLCRSIVDYFVSRKIEFSSYTMDDLAEQIVEHFPTEDKKSWWNRDAPRTCGRFYFRLHTVRRNMAKQTNNTSASKVVTNSTSSEDENSKTSNAKHIKIDDEYDVDKYTLEVIIPKILKKLKDSYESKDSLSEKERRLLCRSIVDYFESRKIKFSSYTMDELAEQIVEHFPTEDKKSWCNRDGPDTRGRLLFRLRNSRRNMGKQTKNTSTLKVATNSISTEDENSKVSNAMEMKFDDEEKFTLEKIIPELLKILKDSYESKDSLSTNERRFLCRSIVDYFESRNIKFGLNIMSELAEEIVQHFPTEDKKSWYDRDGPNKRGRLFIRLGYSRRGKRFYNPSTSKVVTNSTSSDDEYDEEQFTLEIIIPELLKELKDSYESKDSLSENERRLLCKSIVDYFESRKINFSSYTMEGLAEQIVEHFPTEDKKSWCNHDGANTRGRLFIRLRNSRSNTDKPTMKYRCWQSKHLKDLDSIREFLNNWSSYKLETGHELLTMDFEYLYPEAMETFHTRWLVYKRNIEQFLKAELKDVNCIQILEKYQLQKSATNEDSSSCILIYLVHAITKPLRHFEAVNDNVSYPITDSQHSMMRLIRHKAEIDEYTEPYPCIFVVGDSMLEVQECYVVFMDLHYKLSYKNCLAVCVQIFMVLKVEDPTASQCFWEFIRGYMFNITKDKEKFNLATENMVNYLETVASSV